MPNLDNIYILPYMILTSKPTGNYFLFKIIKSIEYNLLDFEQQIKVLENTAENISNEENKQKQIENFNKIYSNFYECLTNQLASYNTETKNEIRVKLNNLLQIIDETINKYLI